MMQKMQHLTEKELEIIEYFYYHKRGHVRKINKEVNMSEHTLLKYLGQLEKRKLIGLRLEGNMKIYESIDESKELCLIYSYIDLNRTKSLEYNRLKAITMITSELKKDYMPYFILLFGSTAKGNYTKSSDMDLISVHHKNDLKVNKEYYKKINLLKQKIKAETNISLNLIPMSLEEFRIEINNKENYALQDALNTGHPIFGNQLYYEVRKR